MFAESKKTTLSSTNYQFKKEDFKQYILDLNILNLIIFL